MRVAAYVDGWSRDIWSSSLSSGILASVSTRLHASVHRSRTSIASILLMASGLGAIQQSQILSGMAGTEMPHTAAAGLAAWAGVV